MEALRLIKTGQSQDFIEKLSRCDLPTAFISTQLFLIQCLQIIQLTQTKISINTDPKCCTLRLFTYKNNSFCVHFPAFLRPCPNILTIIQQSAVKA